MKINYLSINLIGFLTLLFSIVLIKNHLNEYSYIRYSISLLLLLIGLVLPAINLAWLSQKITKQHWNNIQFTNVAALYALTIVPSLYLIEISIIHQHLPQLIFLNSAITFLILLPTRSQSKYTTLFTTKFLIKVALITSAYVILTLIINLAYFPLPELDPYYWLAQTINFSNDAIPTISSRPLFLTFNYFFVSFANIDPYAFFKYITPILSGLALMPLALVASTLRSRWQQSSLLLLLLASPSTWLYHQMSIPQAYLITLSYFSIWLAIYAMITKNLHWYYFAGLAAISSFFFHEGGIIITIAWSIGAIYQNYHHYIKDIKHKPVLYALTALLIITNPIITKELIPTIHHWYSIIVNLILNPSTNLLFPAHYINIDGNAMGWPGWKGVIEYYSWYTGLPIIFIIILLSYLITFKRYQLFSYDKRNNYVIIFIGIFAGICFSIAEILPRVINIAILPERSWIFSGLALQPSLLIFYRKFPKNKLIPITLIMFITISLGGAIYINNLRQYVITQKQLQSAAWIKENTFPNRIIFSNSFNNNLIQYHADSQFINIPIETFCDESISHLQAWKKLIPNDQQQTRNSIDDFIEALRIQISNHYPVDINAIHGYVDQQAYLLHNPLNTSNLSSLSKNILFYYATPDPRNPYAKRPYQQKLECTTPIMDSLPQLFTKIYNDHNKVMIWKINQ